ncbi:MAG: hypothetical protein RhofKO_36890 [Rhodothermales bacterium]
MARLFTSLLLGCLFVSSALSQTAIDSTPLQIGTPIPDLVASTDPVHRYALYLPTSYHEGTPHPIVFLMDPRGGAMRVLNLFRPVAERYGYILMSSYNSLSDADSSFAVNDRALAAMRLDAEAHLNLNPRRYYIAGFSGTAHHAFDVAPQLDGKLAGIIVAGGGMPARSVQFERTVRMQRPYAAFITAGYADFNYDLVRGLDVVLDTTYLPHRFAPFEGRHTWPPPLVVEDAFDWLQLHAMRAALIPRDTTWIADLYAQHLAEAQALLDDERPADAHHRYQQIVTDFRAFTDVAVPAQHAETLAKRRDVRRTHARRDELALEVVAYKQALRPFNSDYRAAKRLPNHKKMLKRLKVAKLHKAMRDSTRLDELYAAERMLAAAFSHTNFYQPRDYFAEGDYERAAGMLRLARAIYPTVPFSCYALARAEAQLGNTDAAFDALTCALDHSMVTPEQVTHDSLLNPLHEDARYQTLVPRAN